MTHEAYGIGGKAVEYIGSKSVKYFEGYTWNGQGSIVMLPHDIAEKALTNHDDVFSEASVVPASVTFSYAAGGANVAEVTISVFDGNGEAVDDGVVPLDVYLSDDAKGAGLTATTTSGTVQPKSGEGTELEEVTAKKHLRVLTKKDAGTFVLEITDTGKTGFYPCAVVGGGNLFTGDQLVTADYGS